MTKPSSQSLRPGPEAALAALRGAVMDLRTTQPRFIGGFYGEPGVGKTVQIMKLAQLITPLDKSIVHVDTSDGTVSLKNHEGLLDRVVPFRFEDTTQLLALHSAIKADVTPFDNVGTVIFDEFTTIARHQVLTVALAREGLDLKKVAGNVEKLKLVLGAIDLSDYNIAQNHLTRLLIKYKSLSDTNILINAHAKVKKENALDVTRPSYAAGIGEAVLSFMHSCGFMYNKVDQTPSGPVYTRSIQTSPTIQHPYCKSRVGGFSALKVSPDEYLRVVMEWLKGNAPANQPEIKVNSDFDGYIMEEE